MKKGLMVLFLCLVVAFMLCACGSPKTSDIKDFLYEAKNGEITITGYTGKELEIVIPDIIDNRPVKYIGETAFYIRNCLYDGSVLMGYKGDTDNLLQ